MNTERGFAARDRGVTFTLVFSVLIFYHDFLANVEGTFGRMRINENESVHLTEAAMLIPPVSSVITENSVLPPC